MKTLKNLVLIGLLIFVIRITDLEMSKDERGETAISIKTQITSGQCKEAGEKVGAFFKYVFEKGKEIYSKLEANLEEDT